MPLEFRICSTTFLGSRPQRSRISAFSASVPALAGGGFASLLLSLGTLPLSLGSPDFFFSCCGLASCFSFSCLCFSDPDCFFCAC